MSRTKPAARAPRRRRSAEEARREILDAAQRRLERGGPEAIRLQELARDVGVSHPAILHHFGSREGLMLALAQRGLEALDADLRPALEAASASEGAALGILERVFETLGHAGHASLIAWLATTDMARGPATPDRHMLHDLAQVLHRRRTAHTVEEGGSPPQHEDSAFVVRLAATAMLGDAVGRPFLDRSAGVEEDPDFSRRFREWLAALLIDHLAS